MDRPSWECQVTHLNLLWGWRALFKVNLWLWVNFKKQQAPFISFTKAEVANHTSPLLICVRPIFSHPSKVMLKMNCLALAAEELLAEKQSEFQAGRSIFEQTFSNHVLIKIITSSKVMISTIASSALRFSMECGTRSCGTCCRNSMLRQVSSKPSNHCMTAPRAWYS